MGRLLGVAFAILLVAEVGLLAVGLAGVAVFPYLLWQRSPIRAVIAAAVIIGAAVVVWRVHRRQGGDSRDARLSPEISISRIPISGLPGAIYMLQFLVWALVTPAVGLFYAALIAGALLLLPIIFHLNRPGRGGASAVGAGALLGGLSGLAVVALVSFHEVPLAAVFMIALGAGILGAPILIWMRGRRGHVSIAPYSVPEP